MYLLQARDSVTGDMHRWTNASRDGTGYPGPNAATELAVVAQHGGGGGGGDPVSFVPARFTLSLPSPGEHQRHIEASYSPAGYAVNDIGDGRSNLVPVAAGDYWVAAFAIMGNTLIDPETSYTYYFELTHIRSGDTLEQWQVSGFTPIGADPLHNYPLSVTALVSGFNPATDVINFNATNSFDIFSGTASIMKVG